MDKTCSYPQCYKCEYEYCIKDGAISLNLPPKRADRSEYQQEYYQRTKGAKKAYYQSKTKYLRYVRVRSTIRKLKKQIGEVNYNLIMDAIEQIEKE